MANRATMRDRGAWLAALVLVALVAVGWLAAGQGRDETNETQADTASHDPAAGGVARVARGEGPSARPVGTLHGRVVDERGTAIASAEVCAWTEASRLHGRLQPTCVGVESDGTYRLAVEVDAVRLGASAPGFLPAPSDPHQAALVRVVAGQTRSVDELVLRTGGIEVRGTVLDVLGGAIEGATVIASAAEPWPRPLARATSDADGTFSLFLPPGQHILRATAEGYARVDARVRAPGRRVEILLEPAASIRGTVVDADGQPVAGSTVELRDPEDRIGAPVTTTTSDERGGFALTGLRPGRYLPTARHDAAFGEADRSVAVGLAESVDDVTITLVPAAAVVVRVTIDGREPCREGFVIATTPDGGASTMAVLLEDGRTPLPPLAPGEYSLLASCTHVGQAKTPEPITAVLDHASEIQIDVPRGMDREGIVRTEDGHPRAGVHVHVFGIGPGAGTIPVHAFSDDEGRFLLRGLAPGDYALRAEAPPRATTTSGELTVTSSDDPPVEIVLAAGATIHGHVRDSHGDPLAGVSVGVREHNSFPYVMAATDDDGAYRIEGIEPGTYDLMAEMLGGSRGEPETIALADGETLKRDLTLAAQQASISGVVLDDEGAPIADAWVYGSSEGDAPPADVNRRREIVRAQIDHLDLRPVLTDADGRFTLPGLDDHPHTLVARRPGGGEAWQDGVVANTRGVRLRLPALASLGGSVATPEGGTPRGLMIRATHSQTGLVRTEHFVTPRSSWSMDELPAGSWTVVAQATEGRASTTITLASGEDRRGVAMELVGHVVLRGRIVDLDTGQPIRDIVVGGAAEGATATDLAVILEKAFVLEQSEQFTTAAGEFSVRVPAGTVRLVALARDLDQTGDYGPHFITATATPAGEAEIQTFALVHSRLKEGEEPGSIGDRVHPSAACEDVVVETLQPDTAAYEAGLRPGDRIVTVDGHDVSGTACYRYYWLTRVPAGRTVELGLADERTIRVTAR